MLHNLSTCQKKRVIHTEKKEIGYEMKAKHYNIKFQKRKTKTKRERERERERE